VNSPFSFTARKNQNWGGERKGFEEKVKKRGKKRKRVIMKDWKGGRVWRGKGEEINETRRTNRTFIFLAERGCV